MSRQPASRRRLSRLGADQLAVVRGWGLPLPAMMQSKERTSAFEPSLDLAFTYQPITWD